MNSRTTLQWFPLWIDKWLFGSTRLELQPDERSVWIDLLSLANKDSGYIRASEKIPYLETQLAGLFNIEIELLKRSIKKCIETNKIEITKYNTLKLINFEEYALTDRHKRRFTLQNVPKTEEEDTMSAKEDAKRRVRVKEDNNNNREEKKGPPTDLIYSEALYQKALKLNIPKEIIDRQNLAGCFEEDINSALDHFASKVGEIRDGKKYEDYKHFGGYCMTAKSNRQSSIKKKSKFEWGNDD